MPQPEGSTAAAMVVAATGGLRGSGPMARQQKRNQGQAGDCGTPMLCYVRGLWEGCANLGHHAAASWLRWGFRAPRCRAGQGGEGGRAVVVDCVGLCAWQS